MCWVQHDPRCGCLCPAHNITAMAPSRCSDQACTRVSVGHANVCRASPCRACDLCAGRSVPVAEHTRCVAWCGTSGAECCSAQRVRCRMLLGPTRQVVSEGGATVRCRMLRGPTRQVPSAARRNAQGAALPGPTRQVVSGGWRLTCTDAQTKKYCCFSRSSLPSGVESLGYSTALMASARSRSREACRECGRVASQG